MNENQNAFLKEGRTTSRVTNEPGGKSSISLGWDSSPKSEPPKKTQTEMKVIGSALDQKVTNGPGAKGVSSNLYANGSSQNTGNVLTSRPSSRVTQPPGGKSSIPLVDFFLLEEFACSASACFQGLRGPKHTTAFTI
ncbi:hypothetical protein ACHAXT_002072 [Thalassiosira profunda]